MNFRKPVWTIAILGNVVLLGMLCVWAERRISLLRRIESDSATRLEREGFLPRIIGIQRGAALDQRLPDWFAEAVSQETLRSLVLETQSLRERDYAAIASASQLTKLGLRDCHTSENELLQVGPKQFLRSLTVTDSDLRRLPPAAETWYPNLESLDLSGTEFSDEGFLAIRGMKSLQVLLLGDTRVTNPHSEILGSLPNLTALFLGGCPLGDDGIAAVQCDSLTLLSLSDTEITDQANLPDLPSLEFLTVSRTQVSDAFVAEVVRACPKLRWLVAYRTNISPSSLQSLSQLDNFTRLNVSASRWPKDEVTQRINVAFKVIVDPDD